MDASEKGLSFCKFRLCWRLNTELCFHMIWMMKIIPFDCHF